MHRPFAILATLLMLLAGLAGGLALTGRLLQSQYMPGTVRIGVWSLWPRAGAPDADPYALALFARRGDIPAAPGEGLFLQATSDESQEQLRASCTYVISQGIPSAKHWTLTAYTPSGDILPNPVGRLGLTSAEAIGMADGGTITISFEPQPGNWLPLPEQGAFTLLLRLYDTPLSAISATLQSQRMPRVDRVGCR